MLILSMISILLSSAIGTYLYIGFAKKNGFTAEPNNRSLHQSVTPKGAGIIISISMLTVIFIGYSFEFISEDIFKLLFIGSLLMSLIGFLDDRLNLSPLIRLPFQIVIASWVIISLNNIFFFLFDIEFMNSTWPIFVVLVFAIVWFYNSYNFIDGIDGMAISSAIFISFSGAMFLDFKNLDFFPYLLAFFGFANLGVLLFNWPPAKVFLGDVGTNFNSFFLSSVILITIIKDNSSILFWLILLGYYLTDTSLTTLIRVFKHPKNWYQAHRSHAYQNLARIWGSHLKMTKLVWMINLFWLLPLAVLAFQKQDYAIYICILAYIPITIFSIKFGPLYSNE